jgi:hypothetical protein
MPDTGTSKKLFIRSDDSSAKGKCKFAAIQELVIPMVNEVGEDVSGVKT